MAPTQTSEDNPESMAAELALGVGHLLRRLRAQADASGLGLSQLSAMARLEQHGTMTTADLARAESMKPQSMGALLAGLEKDGLIERRPHPTDGRQILFALTVSGSEERRQRTTAKRAWLAGAIARLTREERRILAAAMPLIKKLGDS